MSEGLELESLRRRLYQIEARLYRAERVVEVAARVVKNPGGDGELEHLAKALQEYESNLESASLA